MAQLILIGKKWYADMRMNGKRIRRALSVYKPEAKRMLKDLIDKRYAQKHGEIVRDMSWKSFRDDYLDFSLTKKEKDTYYHDRASFDLVEKMTHLTSIDQMTPARLENIQIALIKKNYPPAAISRGLRGMKTAMRWAEKRKFVALQDWRIVEIDEPSARADFYEREAFLTLVKRLDRIDPVLGTAVLIMGRVGLRLGELMHLEWSDIRTNHVIFRSKPQLNWFIKQDKKKLKKVRIIPLLTSDIRQRLESLRRPSGFVLGYEKPPHRSAFSRSISDALEATGIKTHEGKFGFSHVLRHTFGSHLAQLGIPLKQIADWMGHESVRMTECYSHLCPGEVVIDAHVFEKLCTGFVPVANSNQSSPVLLSALNADLADAKMFSEIHKTT